MSTNLETQVESPGVRPHPKLSVVMPCLNEAQTVGQCVRQARRSLRQLALAGEVVVVDNGSTDDSAHLAEEAGARVVHCPDSGYGNAIRCGVEQAYGELIIMGDADASYDFSRLGDFAAQLQQGADLVMGNRFRGGIERGAMPWKNRYLGNPVLTFVLNVLFHAGVGDAHCGLRGFTKDAFQRMETECPGMEFASEMVVKAAKRGLRIVEVPTTLSPDGRNRAPHLLPWRDGWRHLKFLLMFSPVHLFVLPAVVLTVIGLVLLLVPVFGPIEWGRLYVGVHWMVLGALLTLLGLQVVQFGILARLYTIKHRFSERDRTLDWLQKSFRLETGLLVAGGMFVVGAAVDCWILGEWIASGFGAMSKIEPALVATVLMAVGAQLWFFSFLFAIINEGAAVRLDKQSPSPTSTN